MPMKEATSPFAGSRAVIWLFAIGLVTIPFDSVRGLNALGELGFELSFPFFAAAIAAALWTDVRHGDSRILSSLSLRVAAAALAVILLSFAANFSDITSIVFRERTGLNKFATTLLVIFYGFALAWLAEQLEPKRVAPFAARFIGWSAAITSAYLLIEFAGKHGWLGGAFDAIDGIIHTRQADIINAWNGQVNEKVLYGWDPRLRSVSFEPPAFGNYTGFAWPWVWFAAVKAAPERQLRAWGLFALFTAAILLAASRTGLLMLATNIAVMALLGALYARPAGKSEAAAAARLLAPIAIGAMLLIAALWSAGRYQEIVGGLMQGDSVSNISRFGFQVAGFNMFMAHPLLGVGLGQFGFHVVENLPDWIYRSPEVAPMITYPTAPWPNLYSIYARLLAELGIVGLVAWVVLWLGLAARLAARARSTQSSTRVTLHYPIIMNCIGVLVSGIATDTFRTPMIWIALGLGCGVLARSRATVSRASAAQPALVPRHSR